MVTLIHNTPDYKRLEGNPVQSVPFYVGQDIITCLVSLQPGAIVPSHSHEHHDEIFDVLEGEGTFILDDQEIILTAGMTVCVPANTRHGLRAGDQPWILRETVHQHVYARQALKRAWQKRWAKF
ncbi:MAG: cupin domain-containing protein, partial [Chloroflexota bacterium]